VAASPATTATDGTPTSSGVAAGGGTLSKTQLIAKADTICKRLDKEIADASPVGLEPRKIAAVAPPHVAAERVALKELGMLKAPAAMAGDWRQIIAYRRTLAAELAKLGSAARAGDLTTIIALAGSKLHEHKLLSALATRDGFKDCSKVG
jgi:hypothetical protein